MELHHPPTLINGYLSEKLDNLFAPGDILNSPTVPFFPTSPTDIDALTETFPYSDGRFAVYDRMFRMRRDAFPHIKSEQLMYYFYAFNTSSNNDPNRGNAISHVIKIAQTVSDMLDNGDESAEEINYWIKGKIGSDGLITIGNTTVKPVFFHNFRVFQLEEIQDIIDFGTARTYAGNKLILDYTYHKNYPETKVYDVEDKTKLISNTDPVRPFAPGI